MNTKAPLINVKGQNIEINDVVMDESALETLFNIQDHTGEYYRLALQRISDILIEESDMISADYDEILRLLQSLSMIRQDIRNLMRPRYPGSGESGFDIWLRNFGDKENAADTVAGMELAEAAENREDDDDDSEMQYAGK